MLQFPPPDRYLEAHGDPVKKRAQRANRAALDVLKDRNALERASTKKLLARLGELKTQLQAQVLATDFQRFNASALAATIDRLVLDAQGDLATGARRDYDRMADLGDSAAEEPMRAAQLRITPELPGLDAQLVTVAFDNTLELLTQPMQQFASSAKVALRGVALAGENKFDAIARLRDQIAGQGMAGAQYKAERIIRTELGRIFNQSTFDRLVTLAGEFPFLRKGWRAAGDTRTRIGHRGAAQKYARGQGIAITELFVIEVWDERPGKPAKLLGTCRLRFPVDPLAQPQGRLSAAATIMCRCNGFVDFDLAEFAAHSAKQIQLALGGVLPPVAPGPVPVDTGGVDLKKLARTTNFYQGRFYFGSEGAAQGILDRLGVPGTIVQGKRGWSIQQAGTGAFYGPKGWTHPKPAKAKPAPVPDVKSVLPTGPTEGPKMSATLRPPMSGPLKTLHANVMAVIDQVHSVTNLAPIPLKPSSARFFGQFQAQRGGAAIDIKISKAGLNAHPLNTLAHEVGHWLDNQALGRVEEFFGPGHHPQPRGFFITQSYRGSPALEQWAATVKSSPTYERLRTWRDGRPGDGTVPVGANGRHLEYLLSTHETFARSYAQYVAVRSGDPAMMAELRRMQAAATYGPVSATTKFNLKPMGHTPDPNSWDYPVVWQDAEFEPIAAAFDRMFEEMGWRKKAGQ